MSIYCLLKPIFLKSVQRSGLWTVQIKLAIAQTLLLLTEGSSRASRGPDSNTISDVANYIAKRVAFSNLAIYHPP